MRVRKEYDGNCDTERGMNQSLFDDKPYNKPSDEECLELMRQFRTGEFRKWFISLNAYDQAEQEITAWLNSWYPGLFRYMNTMADKDALALAKAKGKPILL